MNLTELQIQLRSIEEHISDLQAEIEKMKPQPEDEKKAMFEKITEMAAKFPLESRRFPKTSNVDVKEYISCLAYISLADDSKIYDKLLFLCRLSHGMGLPMSSEDIFRTGLEIDEKYFDKACSDLKSQKYSFMADALILVNITEEATEASFRLIADIAKIFECEKEDLRAAAMVAKAVLTEDFTILKQIPAPSKNRWMGQFYHHIPAAWIQSQRVKCGEICTEQYLPKNDSSSDLSFEAMLENSLTDLNEMEKYIKNNPCVVKKSLNTGTVVKKDEELILYEESVKKKNQNSNSSDILSSFEAILKALEAVSESIGATSETNCETVTAPCDGIVFFIESSKKGAVAEQMDKYLEVYVVSYFDNYAEFCDWHKKK